MPSPITGRGREKTATKAKKRNGPLNNFPLKKGDGRRERKKKRYKKKEREEEKKCFLKLFFLLFLHSFPVSARKFFFFPLKRESHIIFPLVMQQATRTLFVQLLL